MARIIPLTEGSFTVDASKKFISFDINSDNLQDRSKGSLLVEIQPFLLITDKDYLLLDAGLGFLTGQGNLQLHQNLMNNGINPSDITKVLVSHLHKDHSGGLTVKDDKSGKKMPAFPQAKYYINQAEFDYGIAQDGKSYIASEFESLRDSSNLIMTGDSGTIDHYIHYKVTAAHSPHHQAFWVEDEGKTYFFGGDVAPQLSQMKNRFVAKYDYDGRKSMELRQQYLKEGTEGKWTFLFYHDIKTPYYQF